MPTPSPLHHIVVGLDGSDESFGALDWATGVAAPGGLVDAVHVAEPGNRRLDPDELSRKVAERIGQRTLTVVEGDPVDELLRLVAANGADLIAVGVHSPPAAAPRLLGRTATRLLHHTDRPVGVVAPGGRRSLAADATIVVGIGHGPSTRAALDWAARLSSERGTSLSLVHALVHSPLFGADGALDVMAYYIDPAKIREWALEDLEELAAEIQRSTEADLPISWSAPAGLAGPKLVEAGADAALVVIGRHDDRGGDPDHHGVGATLHHALTHAPCPVVIVPVANG